jgi:hypothetical protein
MQGGGLPPFLYEELRQPLSSLIREDDVVVSTHQLIWTIPDHPALVSFAAELAAMRRWNLADGVEVWERVQPTLIIYVEREMQFSAGLQTYMTRHNFAVCQEIDVLERAIILYRAICP